MAIVSGNCCVSLKCIITPPTSFDPSIYMGTHVETQMYTLTHTHTCRLTPTGSSTPGCHGGNGVLQHPEV